MFRLTNNLFALGCIVALVITSIVLASPHDMDNYMAAAIDKHRLLDTVKSPRIILAGGSNVAFSVDSQKIADYYEMPVINMGLNVNLGLRYMLSEVQPALRDGDILIILPEYDHFSGFSLDGRSRELGTLIKLCPECISGITTPTQAFNVALGIFEASESDILRAIKQPEKESKVYIRQGFNAWGDMVAHLDQPSPSGFSEHISRVEISAAKPAIELLNTFYRSLDAKNVQVFVMFPSIPIRQYKAQKENFNALYKLIEAELAPPVIGAPQDFVSAGNLFYDTPYHMTRAGRDEHTIHMIDMLGSALQK